MNKSPWADAVARIKAPVQVSLATDRLWENLGERSRERFNSDCRAADRLTRLLVGSPALIPFLVRNPQIAVELFLDGRIERRALDPSEVDRFARQCVESADDHALARRIARFRNRHLVHLYAQELLRLRHWPDIWEEWSGVASCCLHGAVEGCKRLLPERGEGVRLSVIGMGKLGSGELNFASDVDILYVYRSTSGSGNAFPAHERAAQWASRVTSVLERVTEEGPAFRIDLSLRPGGKDGDLALTPEAAELYYQTQAWAWERWALLRAHPVAGDERVGSDFIEMVQPFVYRKFLDYGSLEDIRRLKERIEREVRWRRGGPANVKMGEGGIRELEFLVQTFQIIYGGKLPNLRGKNTLATLQRLVHYGLFPEDEGEALREAYLFLRGVEHRIQMVNHRQLHSLPEDEREGRRISWLAGYPGDDDQGFLEDLRHHMSRVHSAFDSLLGTPQRAEREWFDPSVDEIMANLEEQARAAHLLQQAGFERPQVARESIRRILTDRFPAHRSPRARGVLHRLIPTVLSQVMSTPSPDQTLTRLERFLEAVGPRGGYYALLEENPRTLERLIELFSRSALLSRWLGTYLESVDALIDRGHHRPRRSRDDLSQELTELLDGLGDPEDRLGRLRQFRAQEILRIGVADLWGVLCPLEVGEELTNLAEVYLESTLREAADASGHRRGCSEIPLAILGLGTLGGRELSYRSDLDMVFLFDDDDRLSSRRPNLLEEYTKIGQRTLSWIAMPMKEGPGWATDVRLRPSGRSGPLMVSLSSFDRYYREQARTWEIQTLLKARVCAGEESTGQRAAEAVERILSSGPAPSPEAFHSMRMRMEKERANKSGPDGIYLKLGKGGAADIEFLAQYLQMRDWADAPEVRTSVTAAALHCLTWRRALSDQEGTFLVDAHRFYRGIENRLGLILDHKGTEQPCSRGDLEALEPLEGVPWPALTERKPSLALHLEAVMNQVRSVFLHYLPGNAAS